MQVRLRIIKNFKIQLNHSRRMWKRTLMEYKFLGLALMAFQRATAYSQRMDKKLHVHWSKANVTFIKIDSTSFRSTRAFKPSSIGDSKVAAKMSPASRFQLELFELTHSSMTYHKVWRPKLFFWSFLSVLRNSKNKSSSCWFYFQNQVFLMWLLNFTEFVSWFHVLAS